MKNITKKLIAVFSLVTIFSFGANFAFAAGPILSNTGPSSPANTVTLGGAYSNTTGGATTTWFDIATSNSNLVSGNSQV
ncbi:MAG: hypothetical protein NTW62_03535, partial [Candidatus Nomurabacteria bacterium]|nr:hypothetical protein [Candidatus Nomurabacteria bacterium]